jgi:hypothetical protein
LPALSEEIKKNDTSLYIWTGCCPDDPCKFEDHPGDCCKENYYYFCTLTALKELIEKTATTYTKT